MTSFLKETDTGVILSLKVQPRSSKNQWVGVHGDEVKVKLTAPPVDGAANQCCCKFIAESLHVAASQIQLLSGETSRHKRVLIKGLPLQQLHALISQKMDL